eukprot:comp21649_c0_seq1/m.30427 comp21649_c0_seq1/g.30427  ORF comp21649_c0_seq1/g.30427 comp21649_c0_seq1/m.30427 type:complete len:327 (-) comp21649_c0_seq1:275-1255(-)
MRKYKVFSGKANAELAADVCKLLGTRLGNAHSSKTADGECDVEVMDTVRDDDVYIFQSACGEVNDALMELCIMIQACRLAASRRVVAVIPYYPYSKQSKKKAKRRGIPARLVADMLKVAGATQVLCLDLHASQIQGFFDIPCDNLSCEPFLVKYVKEHVPDYPNAVILAKNAGAAKRAVSMANSLKIGFAIIQREYQEGTGAAVEEKTESEDYGLVGDVRGKAVIIVDDLLDSADSFVYASQVAQRRGCGKVYVLVTHGVFAGDALAQLDASSVQEIVVTNSIPQAANMQACSKLRVIDISPLLCEAVRRIHHGESLAFLRSNVPF